MTKHRHLIDTDKHEPYGIEDAEAGDVYVLDGEGGGEWKKFSPADSTLSACYVEGDNDHPSSEVEARQESLLKFNPESKLIKGSWLSFADNTFTFKRTGTARIYSTVKFTGPAQPKPALVYVWLKYNNLPLQFSARVSKFKAPATDVVLDVAFPCSENSTMQVFWTHDSESSSIVPAQDSAGDYTTPSATLLCLLY